MASSSVESAVPASSHWDRLPSDINETLITMRTRLHFQDCLNELQDITGPNDRRGAVIRSIMKKSNKWYKLYELECEDGTYDKGPGQFRAFVHGEIHVLCDIPDAYDAFLSALFNRVTFRDLYYMDYQIFGDCRILRCKAECSCSHTGFPLEKRICRFMTCHTSPVGMYTLDMLNDIRYNMDRGYDCDYVTDDEDKDDDN
jgi:hypothetical protein